MVVSVLALAGCKSTQPQSAGSRIASLTVRASADGLLYDCYEIWQDSSPRDGIPDVDTGYRICDQSPEAANRPVPWKYSLSISIIPAGTVAEQALKSLDGRCGASFLFPCDTGPVPPFVSLTDYDPTLGTAALKAPDLDNGLYFINSHRVSVGSPVYLAAQNTFPPQLLGPANILTASPSFDFNVNPGDTVVVRAIKLPLVSQSPPFVNPGSDLRIAATLSLAGIEVVPNGSSLSTGDDDRDGFAFSFTAP